VQLTFCKIGAILNKFCEINAVTSWFFSIYIFILSYVCWECVLNLVFLFCFDGDVDEWRCGLCRASNVIGDSVLDEAASDYCQFVDPTRQPPTLLAASDDNAGGQQPALRIGDGTATVCLISVVFLKHMFCCVCVYSSTAIVCFGCNA
jgi:hypothetical protein